MIVFDLLFLDGEDLRRLPLHHKARLAAVMERAGRGPLVCSEHVEGHGAFMMRQAAALGLKGVVSISGRGTVLRPSRLRFAPHLRACPREGGG